MRDSNIEINDKGKPKLTKNPKSVEKTKEEINPSGAKDPNDTKITGKDVSWADQDVKMEPLIRSTRRSNLLTIPESPRLPNIEEISRTSNPPKTKIPNVDKKLSIKPTSTK